MTINYNYERAKVFASKIIKSNSIIYSPAVGSIKINSKGFRHLIYKNEGHKRNKQNQIARFYLLKYLKPVLSKSWFYQEYLEEKNTVYWSFIAIIENKIRIKIILKKVGKGNIHFWSIIPIWRSKYYKNIKINIIHKGNPSQD
jgi:hypothetical protein